MEQGAPPSNVQALQERIHQMMNEQWHKELFNQSPPTIGELIASVKKSFSPDDFKNVAFGVIDGSHIIGYELAKELWTTQYNWEENPHNPDKTQVFRGPIHLTNAEQLMLHNPRILAMLGNHYANEHEDPLILIMSSGAVSLWSVNGERLA